MHKMVTCTCISDLSPYKYNYFVNLTSVSLRHVKLLVVM